MPYEAKEVIMKVTVVKGLNCPECDAWIEEEAIPKVRTSYECGECAEIYGDRDEAEKCCKE